MAVATRQAAGRNTTEPMRALCPDCLTPVLVAVVAGEVVTAELYEWVPRTSCFRCAGAHATTRSGTVHCAYCGGVGHFGGEGASVEAPTVCPGCVGSGRTPHGKRECGGCDGSGFIGEWRPDERMLAVDVAWSDEGHLRVIGPATARKRGEGLHRLHTCTFG